jgi:hypothetical protein
VNDGFTLVDLKPQITYDVAALVGNTRIRVEVSKSLLERMSELRVATPLLTLAVRNP